MKLTDILNEDRTSQVKSYDEELGKIMLDVAMYAGGHQFRYKGKVHRNDGKPAITYDGGNHWYKNGKRHREDGPAVVWDDGENEWYLDGKKYQKREWEKKVGKK